MAELIPEQIPNWIDGEPAPASAGEWLVNHNPHDGRPLCELARSRAADVQVAVAAASKAQAEWDRTPAVRRGLLLHQLVRLMQDHAETIGRIVAAETGKSVAEGIAETGGAVQCGLFFAGEGQRLYGRSCTSGVPDKMALTLRRPVGVAGLIIAANTPIANVAWKLFPALVCGNTVVLKAAEDTPASAWFMGRLAREAGLPAGSVNIVQGLGEEAGAPLVEHDDVDLISFTGSTAVGRYVQETAGRRLARVSLELGGKNPLVVCEDADLANAVQWTALSAFSNAGQRCASCSRVIVHEAVYEEFKSALLARTAALDVGNHEGADLGPVINERQLTNMLAAVEQARGEGAEVLIGGRRLDDPDHASGYYMAPTVIEAADPDSRISTTELFGPIVCIYKVGSYAAALALANRSPYGLTASIHTRNVDRALQFARDVESGVAVVNAGTYGSEPHMPFGGVKQSGNGWREPGTEAIDVYTELKDVYLQLDPQRAGVIRDMQVGTTTHNELSISMEVETEFERHRLESFFSKEPETIRWIDELLRPGESFFDVGANVGVFTLYAALRHGATLDVRAFEPAYHNYYRLCRNLALNDATGALAYCLALGEKSSSRTLQLVSNESGSASHSFEGGRSQREGTATAFSQGALTMPLDTLIGYLGFPVPRHIKVDIDGYEEAFVEGAKETLANARVKSVLIEVSDEGGSKQRIVETLLRSGFHAEHPLNFIDDHSRARREKSGNAHIENIIFVR